VRPPVRASFAGREVLTNPPPSSGGILIAFALELLERAGTTDTEAIVSAMEVAQAARTEDFLAGLEQDGFAERFLDRERLARAARLVAHRRRARAEPLAPGEDALGSTTHITAVDGEGRCASVTCSNGTGSGLIVPGTGVHVNNMLGEEDLNPHGFHRHAPGRRMPSMMSPTVVLRDGSLEAGLGSGGSNRIRSAVLQTIARLVAGDRVADAVVAPRVHFEAGVVQAEPGVDEPALESLEARGYGVVRWSERNVFFGGVHAVTRDATGALEGGGDPRRGGAVAYA
jgi:gamma-glutamyltranspeptidase/glutathione hydrolase